METKKVFYKAQEAQKILGVDRNRFNYLVRSGQITRVVLPGSKIGVYPITEVDKLNTLIDVTLKIYNPDRLRIEPATKESLPEMVALGNGLMAQGTSPVELVSKWIDKCPESVFILKSGENEIVGYNVLLAMPENIIQKMLHREIRIGQVDTNLIDDFKPGHPLHIYVREMIALPSKDKTEDVERGMSLIRHMANFIEELGKRGVELEKLYALTSTKDGRKTCQALGFNRMPFTPDPNNLNIIPFELDPKKSSIIFAKHYRENYNEYLKKVPSQNSTSM